MAEVMRRRFTVLASNIEAIQVTEENMEEVAEIVGGWVETLGFPEYGGSRGIVGIARSFTAKELYGTATAGEFVVRNAFNSKGPWVSVTAQALQLFALAKDEQ